MKNKKKIGIISIIIIILLTIILFAIHTLNNITGVYQNLQTGTLIDIENNGVGYYYEENAFYHINTALTWKKIDKNNYQIQFNTNGNTATFDATKKNNRLETQKDVYWSGGTFNKINKKFNDAKNSIYNQFNPTAKSIYDSNNENVWLKIESDQNKGSIPTGTSSIDDIIITKNGQYKDYTIDTGSLSDILGKSPKSVIKYAEHNSSSISKWKKNKGVLFSPLNKPIAFSSRSGISYTGTELNSNDNELSQFILICPTKSNEAVPTIHF